MDFQILVSRITATNRLTICSTCPFATKPKNPICTKCGCHLAIKSRFKMAACPIGKWEAEPLELLNTEENKNDSE